MSEPGVATDYFAGTRGFAVVLRPVLHPPEVGAFMYLAQMVGIGAAMLWNFLANLHWTWRPRPAGEAPTNPGQPPSDVG